MPKLVNGDVVCPGSKNQPHSDVLIVTEFVFVSDGATVPGLIFDQIKFSEEDASTTVQATHIIAGLDCLVTERGELFGIPPMLTLATR